jgi:hypothetical protein
MIDPMTYAVFPIASKMSSCPSFFVVNLWGYAYNSLSLCGKEVVPRMADQPAERRGPAIFGYLGVPDHERVSEEAMNQIGLEVRRLLNGE